MKKLSIILLLILAINTQAQMTVTRKQTGAQIVDGQILIFNSIASPAASLDFYVNNSGASPMRTKIRFVSAVNADGTGMELCFGDQCLASIIISDSYPESGPVIIPPMGRNGEFDHFYNAHTGNGALQDYVFKFYQIDLSGNEIGNSITITYRYQPVMATESFEALENIGVQLKSNIVDNLLNITAKADVEINLFDINGRNVLSTKLNSGDSSVDGSMLNSGIYILNVTTETGLKATTKIVKK